ncbi:polysaccharide biosynthesis tyrosine autokinase [Myxococcota bacterium]|nr:polysaccharide biosynthesis tyrosine autokinase [Myxococcota bacterium]MBU1432033.1 polysaccharide biosynthesis tyrosine autokinase [Myxococcota bacterium]
MLTFSVLVMASTVIVTKRQTKIYRATTQIVIDLAAPKYLPSRGAEVVSLGTGNSWNTEEFFETQYRIIRSRAVLSQVVEAEGLSRDLSFLGLDQVQDPELLAKAQERADPVAILLGKVKVDPIASSRVALIHVNDADPKRAARLANAVAQAYRTYNWKTNHVIASGAVEWLKEQKKVFEDELSKADEDLRTFKQKNEIYSATLGDRQNQLGLDLQDAKKRAREARQERDRMRAVFKDIKGLTTKEIQNSLPEVLTNGLIQRLKEKLIEAQNERTQLLKKYLEKHPDVRVVDQQIKVIAKALEQEVLGVRRSLERELRTLERAYQDQDAEVRVLEQEAAALLELEKGYMNLSAIKEGVKLKHQELILQLNNAKLQTKVGEEANNVRILDEALTPTSPASPRLFFNLFIAAVFALIGSLALVFLVDQLDNTVKNQILFEQLGLTFLGIVPSVRSVSRGVNTTTSDRYVIENPNSTMAETVRTIRTNLLFMSPERSMRSLVVTSAGPREGKTSTCVNIGVTMAMAGSRILLIDSDLRRPRLHKIFDHKNDRGFTDLLMNPEAPPEDYIKETGIDNLQMLCSGPLPPNPSELLQTQNFNVVLERLLSRYDRLIFDSPPVVAVTDAQILGMKLDGALLVIQANQTTREMLRKAVSLLKDVNVHLFGGILNNLNVSRRGAGGYYYHYYRQHGNYLSDEAKQAQKGTQA